MSTQQQFPSRFLGYKLKQFFLRVDPTAVITVADHLRAAEEQALTDDAVLEQLQGAYNVGPDGWPLDMDARRTARLQRFYLTNRPDELEKASLLLRLTGTDDELMEAIFRKYGRNEIGESVDPEENLRESMTHVVNCVNPELLHTVEKMMEKRSATGIPHREFFEKCCAHFDVGMDGWPVQWKARRSARLRRFFALHDPKKAQRAIERLLGDEYSDQDIFTALYKQYGKDELGNDVKDLVDSQPIEHAATEMKAAAVTQPVEQQRRSEPIRDPVAETVPPLLAFQQVQQPAAGASVAPTVEKSSVLPRDDEVGTRRSKSQKQRKSLSAEQQSPAIETSAGNAAAKVKQKSQVRRALSPPVESFDRSRHFVASVAPQLAKDLETLVAEPGSTDERVLQRLYFLGGYDSKGSLLISDEEKTRIKALLYHFVEEYVAEEDVVRTVNQLAAIGRSEQEIWAVAQERFSATTPRPSALRKQLLQIYKRASPEDIGRISAMMVCKYEEGLTDNEVLDLVCKRLGVDNNGWPSDPFRRKRQRLARFFERNDPKKLVLIDSYFLKLPKSEDEVMAGLFRQYGVDELGNRVTAPAPPEVPERQVAANEAKLRKADFQQLLKSEYYQRLVAKYGGESLFPATNGVRLLGDPNEVPLSTPAAGEDFSSSAPMQRLEFPFQPTPARHDLVSPVRLMNLSIQETSDFVKQRNNAMLSYDFTGASEQALVSPEVFATTAPPRGIYHVLNATTVPDALAGWRNYIFTEKPHMHVELDAAALTGRQQADQAQQAQALAIRRVAPRVPWIEDEEPPAPVTDLEVSSSPPTKSSVTGVRRAKF